MLFRPALALFLAAIPPALAQPTAPAAEAARLFEATAYRAPQSTVAVGTAVASAADPRAAEAGAEMLRGGGSAADAAAAIAIALTVVEPQSSGLGGGGFAMLHDARTGRDTGFDGRETAPAAALPTRFLGPDGKPMDFGEAVWGGRSVGVPGTVALAAALHTRAGKLPWAALFGPAIKLARDGWVLTPRFAKILAARRAMVAGSAVAPMLIDEHGKPYPVGTRVKNTALALTLEAVAREGPEAFYYGKVADQIVRAVSQAPRGAVPFTTADLANYRVVERAPVCGVYRGWRLCGMAPPSSGGIAVLQILRQLERFDLAKLGRDNPLAWHLLAESERLAFADREAWTGDPGFVAVPTDGMLDPAYISSRSATIRIDRAMAHVAAGSPPGAPAAPAPSDNEVPGTSHILAADPAGNVVSWTSTIESIFGSGQVASGFFLNNELTDFDFQPMRGGRPSPNALAPGKRPRSSMAPFLVYAPNGRFVGGVGAAGGATIIAQVAKTLVAMIDWHEAIEDAITEPNLYANGDRLAIERGSRLEGMAATLKALGHNVVPADLPSKAGGVMRTGDNWRASADARTEGQAVSAR